MPSIKDQESDKDAPTHYFSSILYSKSVKQVKEIKYTDWEGRKKTADDMTVYTENPKQQQQTPGTKKQFEQSCRRLIYKS